MVGGFNHNFLYKGQLYHVQTEDSGLKSPHIITHLYRGGTIFATRKSGYADILGTEGLHQQVEARMKEQHREMLRQLKNGGFDAVIAAGGAAPAPVAPPAAPAPSAVPVVPSIPPPMAVSAAAAAPQPQPQRRREAEAATSLDDVILSYLVGKDAAPDRS